ncbi:MAG: DUF4861 domain-containing protein [Paludibacter sp.]|nr:DUF4861 domain-containing protein [Paludibacter sp.]
MKQIKISFLCLFSILILNGNLVGQANKALSASDITKSVFEQGLKHTELDFYAGTLMLHGMSEFSLLKGNEALQNRVIGIYQKFGNGEIKAKGSLISYEAGGSGAAFLAWKGVTDKLDEQVENSASKMMKNQKRSPEGILTAVWAKNDQIFIDVAFAVTPYLLYSGLKSGNQEYVDMAVKETLELFKILKDNKTGLLHQARGFTAPGVLSQDNWSRGNGWGAFAIASLVRDLPESHPKRKEVVALAQQFFTASLRYQNKEGLWHQEMTNPKSYVETSGSGLMLYGLGIMLEKGLMDNKYMSNFKLGLSGYTSYIGSDGSVSHTCFSCLNPGKGTKKEYEARPWAFNDHHAFGPVVLAYAQAAKMGIDSITPLKRLGLYSVIDNPSVPRTYVTSARGRDVAWENDRMAYRVFGPAVRAKVGSGVDIWAKKVDYPILDKWYKLNAEGKDYHVDRGEGCDFYDMGKLRGCGGIAIWIDGKPYAAESYDTYKIIKNQKDKIEFEINYNTWNVPEMQITEQKYIEMENGTNLFKVTSTLKSPENKELTVAIGVTTFGKPSIYKNEKKAFLSVWEQINPTQGSLGSAVLANPKNFVGFASYKGDEFILIKVRTNVPFSFYAGAGWEKSRYFKSNTDWNKYIMKETKKADFNTSITTRYP